jgi:DNA-directed RNA polymerase subunit RPC12/RpoP
VGRRLGRKKERKRERWAMIIYVCPVCGRELELSFEPVKIECSGFYNLSKRHKPTRMVEKEEKQAKEIKR